MSEQDEHISVEHFRLKSPRRKKRWLHHDREKKLIRLYHEQMNLRTEMRNLGYEELDPPVQRGWKRFYVLRDDVSRGKDAAFFQGILNKINTTKYSSRRDFKVKRRHRGKKVYVVSGQELEKLTASCFAKKKFSEREAKYFDLVMTREKVGNKNIWLYRFQEPWRFRLKIEPNIIRRTRVKDFSLEKRLDEINHYLKRNNLLPKMLKVVHGNYQWWGRYDYLDLPRYSYHPFRNRSFADILDEYLPTKQATNLHIKPSDFEGFCFVGNHIWFLTTTVLSHGSDSVLTTTAVTSLRAARLHLSFSFQHCTANVTCNLRDMAKQSPVAAAVCLQHALCITSGGSPDSYRDVPSTCAPRPLRITAYLFFYRKQKSLRFILSAECAIVFFARASR